MRSIPRTHGGNTFVTATTALSKKKKKKKNLLGDVNYWKAFDPDVCVVPDWDDGHIPELFRSNNGTDAADDTTAAAAGRPCSTTTLVWRPTTWHSQPMVHVVDDALPAALVSSIYRFTMSQPSSSWGTYVPIHELHGMGRPRTPAALFDAADTEEAHSSETDKLENDTQAHLFATKACAWYVHHTLGIGKNDEINNDETVHGIAVWALRSTVDSHVSYHVDYAEQVRYMNNIVVLPHLAGTLHCSPVTESESVMEGGALHVYKNLEHYETHGYKACKQSLDIHDLRNQTTDHLPHHIDPQLLPEVLQTVVEYQCNRLIIMSGHLPHASTPVRAIPDSIQRVIVGFNVFGHDIGHLVQAAPEHSSAWKRQIKLLKLQQQPSPSMMTAPLTLNSIRELSPSMKKLLVLAKRQRVRDEWRSEYLQAQIVELLLSSSETERPSLSPQWTVHEIVQRILAATRSDQSSSWPTARDIRSHLYVHRAQYDNLIHNPGGGLQHKNF